MCLYKTFLRTKSTREMSNEVYLENLLSYFNGRILYFGVYKGVGVRIGRGSRIEWVPCVGFCGNS